MRQSGVGSVLAFSISALLLASTAHADEQVRVASWNVQSVGEPGTTQYEAALEVLLRVGADVVAINEVGSTADVSNFEELAIEAGYTDWVVADAGPFGSMRTAFLSVFPIVSSPFWVMGGYYYPYLNLHINTRRYEGQDTSKHLGVPGQKGPGYATPSYKGGAPGESRHASSRHKIVAGLLRVLKTPFFLVIWLLSTWNYCVSVLEVAGSSPVRPATTI